MITGKHTTPPGVAKLGRQGAISPREIERGGDEQNHPYQQGKFVKKEGEWERRSNAKTYKLFDELAIDENQEDHGKNRGRRYGRTQDKEI